MIGAVLQMPPNSIFTAEGTPFGSLPGWDHAASEASG